LAIAESRGRLLEVVEGRLGRRQVSDPLEGGDAANSKKRKHKRSKNKHYGQRITVKRDAAAIIIH